MHRVWCGGDAIEQIKKTWQYVVIVLVSGQLWKSGRRRGDSHDLHGSSLDILFTCMLVACSIAWTLARGAPYPPSLAPRPSSAQQ
jgi:hypothetical protein